MHAVLWLVCTYAVLSSAQHPENHRSSHRPPLGPRRLPIRARIVSTSTTPATESPSPAAEATTALPSTTPSSTTVDVQRKEVIDISKQLLAQQHQQQLVLDGLKSATPQPQTQVTNFAAYPGQAPAYQPATQADIQQLLSLMQSGHFTPGVFPTTGYNPQQDTNSGYYQNSPANIFASPNIFASAGDPYQQYQPQYQPQYQTVSPHQYNQIQVSHYNLPQVALPYAPPTTPTYVFHNGQYQVQTPDGQIVPIQFPTQATPASESDATNNASPESKAQTSTSTSGSSETEKSSDAPQSGVPYVGTSNTQPQQPQPAAQAQSVYVPQPNFEHAQALLSQLQQVLPGLNPAALQALTGFSPSLGPPQYVSFGGSQVPSQPVQYVLQPQAYYQPEQQVPQTSQAPQAQSSQVTTAPQVLKSTVARPIITLQSRGGKF